MLFTERRTFFSDAIPGGSAEKAGVVARDVIVVVNGAPVRDFIDFKVAVKCAPIDSNVDLKIWRGQGFP
ncbi:PDZ domain-containing protein [Pseudomonas fluorescens]|uniref:PDZ domain-containing protein n=1 Tax=Pseudomonas fluorescens TaxID=294 RepID=UPI003C6DDE35